MNYSNMSLDMISLESAILRFEVENDIEHFAPTDLGQSEIGNESVSSDFAFGADLFIDSIVTESIEMEPATEGIGAKIIGAIKSIFNAIGNFFKNLFSKNKKVQSSVKSSSTSNTSSQSQTPKKPEAPKTTSQKPSQTATNDAKTASSKPSQPAQQEATKPNTAEAQKPKDTIASIMQELKSIISNEILPKAEIEIKKVLANLVKCVATASSSDMKTAIALVSQKFDKIKSTRLYTEGKGKDRLESVSKTFYHNDELSQHNKALDRVLSRIQDIADQQESFGDTFEKTIEALMEKSFAKLKPLKDKVDSFSDADKDKIEEILEKQMEAQVKHLFAVTVKGDPNVQKALDAISKVCNDHADFCSNMIKGIDENSSTYDNLSDGGKGLFQLCKKYLAISKEYGDIAVMYQQFVSGISLQKLIPDAMQL